MVRIFFTTRYMTEASPQNRSAIYREFGRLLKRGFNSSDLARLKCEYLTIGGLRRPQTRYYIVSKSDTVVRPAKSSCDRQSSILNLRLNIR